MSDEKIKELQKQIAKISSTIEQLSGTASIPTFGEFARCYLEEKLKNPSLRDSTKKAFKNQLEQHLLPAFSHWRLESFSNSSWCAWVSEKRKILQQTNSGFNFFNSRKALVELLSAAKEAGHIEKVPKLDNPDSKKDVGRTLSDSEVHKILWHSRKPFRFIFYVFWKMGCRPQEILRWEWSMIRWNEPGKTWIDIPARISKTDRSRKIPLNPDVSRFLYARFLRGNGSPFVFPARGDTKRPALTYQSAWSRACRLAGVQKAVVYDFRRSAITRWAAEGMPTLYIAKLLDTSVKLIESTYAKDQTDVMEQIVKK